MELIMARFEIKMYALTYFVSLACFVLLTVPAFAQAPDLTVLLPDANSPRTPDVKEYARDVLENPWDFNELTDASIYENIDQLSIIGGILYAETVTSDPQIWLLHNGYASAQNLGRTGQRYPIDPQDYRLLSIRMYSENACNMSIYWYRGTAASDTMTQHVSPGIPVYQGWYTYRIRLDTLSSSWLNGPGSTDLIHGFRIDPSTISNNSFRIDWIRLSGPGTSSTSGNISWISDPGTMISIYHDTNDQGFNGQLVAGPIPASGSTQHYMMQTDYLPHPGVWIYLKADNGISDPVYQYAPDLLDINSVPLTVILDPDETGPVDYGQEISANPWDMSDWEDIDDLVNITDAYLDFGVLRGTAGGAVPTDAQVFLPIPEPINTRRFASAEIRMSASRWTVMRLLWRHELFTTWQVTDDFIVNPMDDPFSGRIYPAEWNTYRIDDMNDLILEPACTMGWSGDISSLFRIDPTEHSGAQFGLDYFLLCPHDMADNEFTIKWDLTDTDDFVDLSWYWKDSPESNDSTLISTIHNVSPGQDSLIWDMSQLESGTYFVSVRADDGINSVAHRSHGRLILNRLPRLTFTQPGPETWIEMGNDYATLYLNDPWDMEQQSDIDQVIGFSPASITWTDGLFHGTTNCIDPYFLWQPNADPIQAGIYKTLSFRMNVQDPQDRPIRVNIYWWPDQQGQWANYGFIDVDEGWLTYTVDLSESPDWQGNVQWLRIDPVLNAGVTVELDWVRLTEPGSSTYTLRWEDTDPDDDALIDIYACSNTPDGEEQILAIGLHEDDNADSLYLDVSPLPTGDYYIKAILDDGINAAQISQAPMPIHIIPANLEPLEISGAMVSSDTIRLSWIPPMESVSSYSVYRESQSYFVPTENNHIIDVSSGNTSIQLDLGPAALNPALNYYYRMTWSNSESVESPPSNTVGVIDFSVDN